MKKVLVAAIAASLMSVTAMATEGTISAVIVKSDGSVKVTLAKAAGGSTTKAVNGATADANKAMLATALTAKSSGATVDAFNDGTIWTNITLK